MADAELSDEFLASLAGRLAPDVDETLIEPTAERAPEASRADIALKARVAMILRARRETKPDVGGAPTA